MTRLSGITPSGSATLGNYLGAVRRWAREKRPGDLYFVSDLHGMTTPYHPQRLRARAKETLAILIASGIDEELVFVQSDLLPQLAPLTWVLECTCSFGEAARMTQFKEKSATRAVESTPVRVSLLTYPVLMAADILLQGADEVPVGDDQAQHVELARALARRCVLADGDVLISRANTRELVGLVGRYKANGYPCIYPDLMMRLRPDESRCLPAYLELVLRSNAVRKSVRAGARGTSDSMVKISATLVEGLEIPLPALDEQRRIVAAHAAFERRIGALEATLGKLRIAEQALSTKALTPAQCDEWDQVPLEFVATVVAGVTLGSEPVGDGTVELPYLRVANVLEGLIDTADMKRVRILSTQYARYALKQGDLLLTEGGDLDKLGRGAVWDGRIEHCLHQNHVFRVRCRQRMTPDFLALYTASTAGRAYFQRVGKQTTNLASINSTQVKKMPVPVPPLEEQERLLGPIRAARERAEVLEKQIAKLRTVQQGVVEDLLTSRPKAYTV